ncbi:hypothetical protein M9H77_22945 [Catharanthus roseus]|uniref:Uncharacterized protein n=1 Tax=Catharanthus roseus TaxID=4058 RepID=A0ACC0AT48_CATRO|nr:hypothetical protein M9H77_22945 [Catharanthus roseus]
MFTPRGKGLVFGVFSNKLTWRKSSIKRIELDLNPRESENEAVSNNLEREMVATPPFRQGSPMNEGHSGHIYNTILEIGEENAQIRSREEERKDCQKHVQQNIYGE